MRDLESLHGFSCGPLKDGLDVLTLPQLQNQLMIFLYVQNRQVVIYVAVEKTYDEPSGVIL